MFGKRQKELIVKLEAYKADIMIDEFREVAQQIIAKNDQYILDIQDKRKRMDFIYQIEKILISRKMKMSWKMLLSGLENS